MKNTLVTRVLLATSGILALSTSAQAFELGADTKRGLTFQF
ncbi:hypothetical protein SAMN04488244_1548, partial [Vibrio hangzhouensis]